MIILLIIFCRPIADENFFALPSEIEKFFAGFVKNTFTGIAHDFNNLLMGIQGRTSLVLADMHGKSEHTEHLRGIEAHVKDAADLTRQLLGFAKGGKFEVLHVGRQMLERLGYDVLEAPDGRQALDLYARAWTKIDLVVLDMIMPDLGGSEVYDGLKEINPQVKVILSSGYSINGRAAEILERGCNGFIQKPFDLSTLSMKIENVLGPKTELPAAEGRRQ